MKKKIININTSLSLIFLIILILAIPTIAYFHDIQAFDEEQFQGISENIGEVEIKEPKEISKDKSFLQYILTEEEIEEVNEQKNLDPIEALNLRIKQIKENNFEVE